MTQDSNKPIMYQFSCDFCKSKTAKCLICDAKESLLEKGRLIKCSTANCNKFYHPKCIKGNKLFKYYDANKHRKFRCSIHYCFICGISGDTMTLFQCFRCYRAYHSRCIDKEKIIRLTKKLIICEHHDIAERLKKIQLEMKKKKKI